MEGKITVARGEILDALRTSISDFTAENGLDSSSRQDTDTASRMNWVVDNGRRALDELTVFFTGRNARFYSEQFAAEYIWISCIFNDADSGISTTLHILLTTDNLATVNTGYSRMESLEEFWLAKEIIHVRLSLLMQ